MFELRFRENCVILRKSSDDINISQCISQTMEKVNHHILTETGYYQGMKTTLVVAVLDTTTATLYHTSIGDSRLYSITDKGIVQLSKDEVKAVIRRKQDGTPITQGVSIVNGIGVTNLLGARLMPYEINSIKITKSTSFLLASDGFYDKMIDADVCLPRMHSTVYFENQFKHLQQEVLRQQDDDASAVFFRVVLDADNEQWQYQKDLFEKLLHYIEIKDEKAALEITSIITFGGYENSFEFFDAAIKRMRALAFNSSALHSELVGLLRESRMSY